ncbi:MAG: micrococcal nuclease [Parcubacteria group bacterium Gr01-1014_18]|nr:MAG: micrococcal nuclease [Parcubacteria group bacterium Greene0416_36]TSC80113.1 MAG: micrococcal nuclease [Parcubacteria group bacterium Gr01-1014_18]TSC98597.1 MAG: micrococcal nuclease [Parcubacteria group bacterium Greene1014_20]TSD06424.1 MAG: micrococcal nuclease [Parcubacteria group bacterium Greene0714_2]
MRVRKKTYRLLFALLAGLVVFLFQGELLVSLGVENTGAVEDSRGLYPVTRVVDGDTIHVMLEGKDETIRFIGINTPETKDPRKKIECFGTEASAFAKSFLEGQRVRLEADSTQEDRDKYGRLLRYVYLEDGTLVNEILIREGYAHEYTYKIPYRFVDQFNNAEALAEKDKKGLWGEKCTSVN